MPFGPTSSAPLFFVGSIPVRVSPMFIIMPLVLSGGRSMFTAVAWLGVVFVSVLVHELGHALAVIRYGGEPEIDLHGMGGTTSWSNRLSLTPGQHVVVSLAGPFAGFLLGGLMYALAYAIPPTNDGMYTVLEMALFVNIAWGFFNLLPIGSLDGGHVVQSLIAMKWPERAQAASDVITVLVGLPVFAVALYVEWIFVALIVAMFTVPSLLRMRTHVERVLDASAIFAARRFVGGMLTDPAAPDARAAEKLVERARTQLGRVAATEALVWSLLEGGAQGRVHAVLEACASVGAMSPPTEARVDTAQGRPEAAITRLASRFARDTGAAYALLEACAEAGDEETARAVLAARKDAEALLRVYAERALGAQRHAAALAAFELLHLITPSGRWAREAARTLVRMGRAEEAREALHQALARENASTLRIAEDPELAPLRS